MQPRVRPSQPEPRLVDDEPAATRGRAAGRPARRARVAHAVEVWSTDAEFGYGFFIVPISLLLIWWRREALRRSIGPGAGAGLLSFSAR